VSVVVLSPEIDLSAVHMGDSCDTSVAPGLNIG
jgi:hypothetical protein